MPLSAKHLPFLKKQPSFPLALEVKAVRIIDGDTFDSSDDQRIRLAGANAPEYPKGCLAQEAKNRLQELILGKTVKIEPVAKDSFNRQIAYVFLAGVLVDKILVEEGLAQAQTNNPKYDPQILSSQEKAEKIKKEASNKMFEALMLIASQYEKNSMYT